MVVAGRFTACSGVPVRVDLWLLSGAIWFTCLCLFCVCCLLVFSIGMFVWCSFIVCGVWVGGLWVGFGLLPVVLG